MVDAIAEPTTPRALRHGRSQVFSPAALSTFMARLLLQGSNAPIGSLLDPGAGAGALTESVLSLVSIPIRTIMVERDPVLADHLSDLAHDYRALLAPGSEIVREDFLVTAPRLKAAGVGFTHVIMNPPYQRILLGDGAREHLALAGLQVPNLYAAFLWWGVQLLRPQGRLVAVVPRSFLSGRQFRHLRTQILSQCGLVRLHHFRNRKSIFGRDSVQQEVVVVCLVKGKQRAKIAFSSSDGLDDLGAPAVEVPSDRLISTSPDDQVVLVPASADAAKLRPRVNGLAIPPNVRVSVGSIVDFRHSKDICEFSDATVPLVGSEIFSARPIGHRAIRLGVHLRRHIKPPGEYVVIRRISPPESRPRLQAVHLRALGGDFARGLTFENHVLVVHADGRGMNSADCERILDILSSNSAQEQIAERCSSTQINASDVLAIKTSIDERAEIRWKAM
ncbi:Eco57I restriction-modification methylase domain-containing protein [uncultured Microbacterium sp.]|uniref:Eco57I restriction-modification methylase domain-containing protein n=1 Tax=uncultured Microbacterium sp. TaxID=191216 RepID=UPI0025E88BE5|nr:Eco57I restriction-modification methylase domain-containing protein [uncultured Microbacterium sp.]